MYRSYQGLCFISVVLLTLTGCASKATAPPPKPTVAPAPVKSLVNTCKPLDAKTKQAISGDSRMADQLDEPARTLEGDMTAAGQCNISNIRRMVRWKSKQVLRCYDEAKGARAGRVVMRWEVTGAGKVGGLCVKEDAVKSVAVNNCLYRVLRLLRFEKPKGTCVKGAIPAEGLPTHSQRPVFSQSVTPRPLLYMSSICCSVSAPEKKTSGMLRYSADICPTVSGPLPSVLCG